MRLLRYACHNGSYSSNTPDWLFATPSPAWHLHRPGNNFGSRVWPARLSGWLVSWPFGRGLGNKNVAWSDGGDQEEKVRCSEGIYSAASESSSSPKIKNPSPRKITARREENPRERKIRTAKKEEYFSENLLKKIRGKQIHF